MFPLPLDNLDRLRLEEPLSETYEGKGSSGPTFYRCWSGLPCQQPLGRDLLLPSAVVSPSFPEQSSQQPALFPSPCFWPAQNRHMSMWHPLLRTHTASSLPAGHLLSCSLPKPV